MPDISRLVIEVDSKGVVKATGDLKAFEGIAGKAGKSADNTTSSFNDMQKSVTRLAEAAAALKALSVVKDMGVFALQTADSFQTVRNQFGILLNDMQAGAGLFNEIKAFNDKTPFDLSTLTQATNVLIAAKVPLQDLQAQLTKFGDLSQGNSQKMTSYVNAFSQAAAKGTVDMRILNTYLHQGVPILEALAKNFNVTEAEIVKMCGEGKIGFADFSKALDKMTASGGQYFGGMEVASKSLAAMQEGLREAANSLAASYGDILMPSAVGVTDALTQLANLINDHPLAKGVFAGAIVTVTGLMTAMAVKAAVLAVKMWLAQAAQMSLNASLAVTNPLLWAGIAAAAAATAGYVHYAAQQQKVKKSTDDQAWAQKKLNDALRDGVSAAQAFYRSSLNFDFSAALYHVRKYQEEVDRLHQQHGWANPADEEMNNLKSALERFKVLRGEFIENYYNTETDDKIKELLQTIEMAKGFLENKDINSGYIQDLSEDTREDLESIIRDARAEIGKLNMEELIAGAEEWVSVLAKATNYKEEDVYEMGGLATVEKYAAEVEAVMKRFLAKSPEHGFIYEAFGLNESDVYQNAAQQMQSLLQVMTDARIKNPWSINDESYNRVLKLVKEWNAAADNSRFKEIIDSMKTESAAKNSILQVYDQVEKKLKNGGIIDPSISQILKVIQENGINYIAGLTEQLADAGKFAYDLAVKRLMIEQNITEEAAQQAVSVQKQIDYITNGYDYMGKITERMNDALRKIREARLKEKGILLDTSNSEESSEEQALTKIADAIKESTGQAEKGIVDAVTSSGIDIVKAIIEANGGNGGEGDPVVPLLDELVLDELEDLTEGTHGLAEEFGNLIEEAGGLAGEFASLSELYGQYAGARLAQSGMQLVEGSDVGNFIQGFQDGGIWGAIIETLIGALTKVIGGMEEMEKALNPVTELLSRLEGVIGFLHETIMQVFDELVDALKPLLALIGEVLQAVKPWVSEVIHTVTGALRDILSAVMPLIAIVRGVLTPVYLELAKALRWFFDGLRWFANVISFGMIDQMNEWADTIQLLDDEQQEEAERLRALNEQYRNLYAALKEQEEYYLQQRRHLNAEWAIENFQNVNDAIITPRGTVFTHPEDYIIATKNPGTLTGGGSASVNITVINNANAAVSTQERTGADGIREIQIIVDQFVQQGVAGGKYDGAFDTMSARRSGKRITA